MKSGELRQNFLKFFQDRGHKIIPSASLVPKESVDLAGTKRVLFTTAGMHPLIPYLLGQPHPEGNRLVNVQRCLRTDDIDEVGDGVHNTFFEMLGNWSLGDYWKEETISWSWEFLINVLRLNPKRIYVSVFAGDDDAPFDEESYKIWQKLGVPQNHIFKYGKDQNWWGPVGPTGPCGPDTEMFYDLAPSQGKVDPASDPSRFVEIWNDVFMQYDKQSDGTFVPLKQKNVDTGMGLERIAMILQGKNSVYDTDLFEPLLRKINSENSRGDRILLDHFKSSIMLIADGVSPSNKDRGYVLRRLIRRAIAKNILGGIQKVEKSEIRKNLFVNIIDPLIDGVVEIYGAVYPNIVNSKSNVSKILKDEVSRFAKSVGEGLRQFARIQGDISGKAAFDLYQNYGFPIELTIELAGEKDKKVDVAAFEKEFKKHRELSRKAGEKTKGGLAVQSDQAARLHTATHLLHQALRDILGHHVVQTGSNITDERLRFDFQHHQKMTDPEIKMVEKIVNEKIKDNLTVYKKVMPKEAADEAGAIGLFDEKYSDLVNVYYMSKSDKIESAYSKEFCGGPHSASTSELGRFRIVKEESVGAGIRRIYATID